MDYDAWMTHTEMVRRHYNIDAQSVLERKFLSIFPENNKTEHAYGKYLSYWDIDFGKEGRKTYIIWRFKPVDQFQAVREIQKTFWETHLKRIIQDTSTWNIGHDLQIPLFDFGVSFKTLKDILDFYNQNLRHMTLSPAVSYTLKHDGPDPSHIVALLRLEKPEQSKEQPK